MTDRRGASAKGDQGGAVQLERAVDDPGAAGHVHGTLGSGDTHEHLTAGQRARGQGMATRANIQPGQIDRSADLPDVFDATLALVSHALDRLVSAQPHEEHGVGYVSGSEFIPHRSDLDYLGHISIGYDCTIFGRGCDSLGPA